MRLLHKIGYGVVLALCLMVSLGSCKPTIPSQYLSKGKMTDILYDFHLAEAMSNMRSNSSDTALMITYREAVLKKHGVTSAEFDSSMVYYMRHTKLLHDIYIDLGDRLTAAVQSLGADVDANGALGTLAVGDTADVWKGPRSMVFSAYKPVNYDSFEIPVDSGFHKGDKLMLNFDAQFLFQDGMRDGIAVVAITFKNDSVYSSNVRITSSQHFSLQLEDRDSLGIKSVKGYFLLNNGDYSSGSGSATTLKMMFLQNIKMVRMHPKSHPQSQSGNAGANNGSAGNGNVGSVKQLPPGKLPRMEMTDESRPQPRPRP